MAKRKRKKGEPRIGDVTLDDLRDCAAQLEAAMAAIEGEVLADNQRMLSLMKGLGFSVRPATDDPGLRIVERWL